MAGDPPVSQLLRCDTAALEVPLRRKNGEQPDYQIAEKSHPINRKPGEGLVKTDRRIFALELPRAQVCLIRYATIASSPYNYFRGMPCMKSSRIITESSSRLQAT